MAMVAFAAIAVTACEPNAVTPGNDSFALTVDVDNITATSAKIKVTHNGKMADSWYGLLTTDVQTAEDTLIAEAVAELKNGDVGTQLIFSKNYIKILSPLTPATAYKYIAFGLTEEGKVYGEYSSVQFETPVGGGDSGDNGGSDEVYDNMIVNPSWSIAYTGAGTINGEQHDHIISVASSDNNPYSIVVVYASEYDVSNLKELGGYMVENMYEYLNAYNSAYGTSYTLNDLLMRGNGSTYFDDLDPGYYIAIAMGITSEGEVSGLYAVSTVFEVKEQAPTSLYAAWLGDWVVKGDNNVSNDVVIGRKVANKSINLMGWMGLPFSIVGEYSTERNDIIFYAQMVYQNYEFSDGTVANIVLLGSDKEGKVYGLDNGNYGIAIAGVMESQSEGSQRAIVRYGVNDIDYPKFVTMALLADIGGKLYTLGSAENMQIPSFNIMAEIDAPEATRNSVSTKHYKLGYRALPTPTLHICREVTNLSR